MLIMYSEINKLNWINFQGKFRDEEGEVCTLDGTVDWHGRPAIKSKSGGWVAGTIILCKFSIYVCSNLVSVINVLFWHPWSKESSIFGYRVTCKIQSIYKVLTNNPKTMRYVYNSTHIWIWSKATFVIKLDLPCFYSWLNQRTRLQSWRRYPRFAIFGVYEGQICKAPRRIFWLIFCLFESFKRRGERAFIHMWTFFCLFVCLFYILDKLP